MPVNLSCALLAYVLRAIADRLVTKERLDDVSKVRERAKCLRLENLQLASDVANEGALSLFRREYRTGE